MDRFEGHPDEISDTIFTTASIETGDRAFGAVNTTGDVDWYEFTLKAGEWAQFTVDGDVRGDASATGDDRLRLADAYLEIYDDNGRLVARDEDSGTGQAAMLNFGAAEDETFYVAVGAEDPRYFGGYQLTMESSVPDSPTTSIDWGTKLDDNVVTVYFVPNGESRLAEFGEPAYESSGFTAYERGQFQQAFDRLEALTDLEFQITNDPNADLQLVLSTDDNFDFLGFFNPPGEDYAGVGVFNGNAWDRQSGGDLALGGFGYVTLVHEILHGLGLAHPHDDGGTSSIMLGVDAEFDDLGFGDMNQGIFTIMTYNSGYLTGTRGSAPPASGNYGYEAGPMALDIAVLQEKYGAGSYKGGNTLYRLPDANGAGTYWEAIWDTGGSDEIRYDGSRDATIDLRTATLKQGENAGGFVSAVDGIAGGYTIAKGVVIERAVAGDGDDFVGGNSADNRLYGRDGNDRMFGFAGDDLMRGGTSGDRVSGGDGNDTGYGDGGNDRVYGGEGRDTLYGGSGDDKISGSLDADRLYGDDDDDRVNGGGSNDWLYGGQGDDRLTGVNGQDYMRGGGGNDVFDFNKTTESKAGADDRDVIFDFTRGRDTIDLRTIDADTTRGGNQAFDMIGGAQFSDAGQVRSVQRGDNRIVQVNTDNNLNTVEMEIELRDSGAVFGSDFIL